MPNFVRLTRSALYVPCDKLKAMEKAAYIIRPDIIIFDLEDAVSPQNKDVARNNLYNFISNQQKKITSQIIVRVNCRISTRWGHDDMLLVKDLLIDGLAIPKVNSVHNLSFSAEHIENKLPIWCMIETAQGVRNVNEIMSHKRVQGLIFGSNDLMKDLTVYPTKSRAPLWYSMSKCIVAAKSENKIAIDGVFMNIKDAAGLQDECIQGRDFGFDGKSLIHPSQVHIANTVFSPSEADVAYAQEVIAAYQDATTKGLSVAVLNDKLIENLHVEQAKKVIARSLEAKKRSAPASVS
jgi:(3S)-malyl-CoA thioesterase